MSIVRLAVISLLCGFSGQVPTANSYGVIGLPTAESTPVIPSPCQDLLEIDQEFSLVLHSNETQEIQEEITTSTDSNANGGTSPHVYVVEFKHDTQEIHETTTQVEFKNETTTHADSNCTSPCLHEFHPFSISSRVRTYWNQYDDWLYIIGAFHSIYVELYTMMKKRISIYLNRVDKEKKICSLYYGRNWWRYVPSFLVMWHVPIFILECTFEWLEKYSLMSPRYLDMTLHGWIRFQKRERRFLYKDLGKCGVYMNPP